MAAIAQVFARNIRIIRDAQFVCETRLFDSITRHRDMHRILTTGIGLMEEELRLAKCGDFTVDF
jgi:hypothetical protein